MSTNPTARDLREFREFLRHCTARQVQGVYDKERAAGREHYADLAIEEARARGFELDADGKGNWGRVHP